MTNFKTPLRGQQELTLPGSEKTISSLVVFIFGQNNGTDQKNVEIDRERGIPFYVSF